MNDLTVPKTSSASSCVYLRRECIVGLRQASLTLFKWTIISIYLSLRTLLVNAATLGLMALKMSPHAFRSTFAFSTLTESSKSKDT